jgi:hypothetical protein
MTPEDIATYVAKLRRVVELADELGAAPEVPLRITGSRIADIAHAQLMLYALPTPGGPRTQRGPHP